MNKTLHATDAVLQALSGNQLHRDGTSSFPPYRDSHLTTLLTHQLGGNCLTCAIIFFTENDPQGSKASLELGQRLAAMVNYPVINNEMVQGLTRRVNGELEFLREALAVKESTQVSTVAAADPNLVKRVHELEGTTKGMFKESILESSGGRCRLIIDFPIFRNAHSGEFTQFAAQGRKRTNHANGVGFQSEIPTPRDGENRDGQTID